MNILNPRSWFAPRPAIHTAQEKASLAGPVISSYHVGQPVWTPRDYANLSKEAYQLNAISYSCVKMISTAAASIGILLQDRTGKEIESHPLLDLLARPSPVYGGNALFEAMYAYLLLSGNTYLEAVGPDGQAPRELWVLRPDRMKVIAGPQGIPQGYRYEAKGIRRDWQVDPLTGQGEILHVKEFNPLDDWYGMSRVEAAAYGIDRHNAASAHNKALLDNGARPSGALVFEPVKGTGSDGVMHAPESVIRAAERDLTERHVGAENAGRPMVMGGMVKWLEMGISPKDMDFAAGKDDAARDICIAYRVPHVLIVRGASTYNNVAEAKLELYEDNIVPLVEHMIGDLNVWLAPRFGEGLKLIADLDSVSALEPRRVDRRKSVTDLLDKGVLDEEEAREALQYGPRPEGSVRKVDASVLTALLKSAETVGLGPLIRYMKAVNLVDQNMTEEQILATVLALVEDDDDPDDDDDDTNSNPDDEDDDDAQD